MWCVSLRRVHLVIIYGLESLRNLTQVLRVLDKKKRFFMKDLVFFVKVTEKTSWCKY